MEEMAPYGVAYIASPEESTTDPDIVAYNEGEDKPFAIGNVGDYVVNDNGTFRIMSDAAEMTDVMLRQK